LSIGSDGGLEEEPEEEVLDEVLDEVLEEVSVSFKQLSQKKLLVGRR